MRRRDLLLALGAALASPLALSQQPGKIYRIGFLGGASPTPENLKVSLEPFRQAMRERGWNEGVNYAIVERWAEGNFERHDADAAELVRLGVDVFLMAQAPAIRAAMKATRTIPIVMVAPGAPEQDGFIASYARPGGNVTGLSYDAGVSPFVKQLDYMRQAVGGMSAAALLVPEALQTFSRGDTISAAKSVNVELRTYVVRGVEDVERAFASMKQDGMQAVFVVADGMIVANTARIAQMALKQRLPLSSQWHGFPPAGGLMAYGPDLADQYRRSAGYVDKLFKGAKPADLPVERPTRFKLIINRKTAKALGLTVPQTVLLVADEVIE